MNSPLTLDGFFLDLYINYGSEQEESLSVPLGLITQFSHKRNESNVTNSFSLDMLGELSLDLEYKLVTGNKRVAFRYGWQNSKSLKFTGNITGFETAFKNLSVAISVTGVSGLDVTDSVKMSSVWRAGVDLDTILTTICLRHGWQKGFTVASKPLQKDVYQTNQTDVSFLTNTLPQYLSTLDSGLSNYGLWFTFDNDRVVLNYAPPTYRTGRQYVFVYDLNGSVDSKLLSFTPSENGTNAFSIGSSIYTQYVDKDTGEIKSEGNQINSGYGDDYKEVYGDKVVFANPNSATSIVSNSSTPVSRMQKYWEDMSKLCNQAKAEIIGEPTIEVGDFVDIIVMLKDGRVHYTSGRYRVITVEDLLSRGSYKTVLDLVKISSSVGDYLVTVGGLVNGTIG